VARRSSGSKVVYAALVGNLLIAITKFTAAFITGSSAMLSEAVHSTVDTSNELLLLYGMHRAKQPADAKRPFGYGRELYFWSFIVALMVFGVGAGVSFYEGIAHILHPEPIQNPLINYIVLGLSFLFEFGSWMVALREFRATKGELGYLEAIDVSKDPTTFTVLFEDSAALTGLLIAFVGIVCAQHFQMPMLDGVASLGIACVLAVTGITLAHRTKELLVGERTWPALERSILATVSRQPGIARANGLLTSHIGPDQIVVALSVEFEDSLTAPEIEKAVNALEQEVKVEHPEVSSLFVKPQTAATWESRRAEVEAGSSEQT
jgi:cation diffusion facilitator family transporter